MDRKLLNYQEYASKFLDVLRDSAAPDILVQSMEKKHEEILNSRLYAAPEMFDEKYEKYRLFKHFVHLAPPRNNTSDWKEDVQRFLQAHGW